MATVFERRASAIIYKLAISISDKRSIFLLPANICPVVPFALLTANRNFEFIDIDPQTLCINYRDIERRIKDEGQPTVGAIIYVRTYGAYSDIEAEFNYLKNKFPHLMIIDDRCLTRPEPDRDVINFQGADVVLYSTGYAKYLDLGFGGFAHLTSNILYRMAHRDFIVSELKSLTDLYKTAIKNSQSLVDIKQQNLHSIISEFSRWLDITPVDISWSEYRQSIFNAIGNIDSIKKEYNYIYESVIPSEAQLPSRFNNWRFQLRTVHSNILLDKLFSAGLFASNQFYPASKLFFGSSSYPVAERVYVETVNLFNDLNISRAQVEQTADLVRNHVIKYM